MRFKELGWVCAGRISRPEGDGKQAAGSSSSSSSSGYEGRGIAYITAWHSVMGMAAESGWQMTCTIWGF